MNAGAILAIVLAAALPAVAAAAAADEEEPHPYYSFVPGRFAVIGQLPDGGAAYQGQARIAHVEGRLQLLKEIGGESVTAEGTVERADPGEADVIRFRGKDFEQTCLVRLDLDNYARLSCLWTAKGTQPRQPGLEAYFSMETWPGAEAP